MREHEAAEYRRIVKELREANARLVLRIDILQTTLTELRKEYRRLEKETALCESAESRN